VAPGRARSDQDAFGRGAESCRAREGAVREARADGSPAQAGERRPRQREGKTGADAGADGQGQEVDANARARTGGAMQAVVIGIIAAIIGLGVGYMTWGPQASQAQMDVAAAKAKLEEARKAAEREGQLATKIQDAEAKLKAAQESLKSEQDQT